ncbi:MAG: glycosyltransferase family 4 protein [Nitrospinaceae bacterium]
MIKSHFILMMRNPLRYWGALWFLFHRSEPNRFQEFAQAGSLAAVVQFSGITHLHTHYANEPAGVAELVYHLTGIPFSISTHAKDIYLSSKESLRRKMSRSRFIVTCTEFNKRYLRSIATCKTPIVKVYHGLFTDKFKPERNDGNGGPPHEVPLILSVGRFRKKKGFPTLLQACRWLKDEGIDFRCKIVGFGPEKDSLDRWIETLSIGDKVQLEGKMVHEELIGLYRKADLFVLPCQVDEEGDRDGIPNVIMEAMAMEIPVISTTVSGIPELIDHEKTGILVPPKDPGALKSAMKHLLGQPTLRQNLGFAGRRRIVHYFDAKHHIEQLKALINHTLDPASAESITQEKRVKDYVH